MAGSKLIGASKVQASTILEVIIAMVVIMLVFGIAMMIFTNITRSSLSVKKIQAQAILNETELSLEKIKDDTGHIVAVSGDFRIDQTIKNYNGNKSLFEIDLVAYDINQQKVSELHKVILSDNE